jgi:hypothetical protein
VVAAGAPCGLHVDHHGDTRDKSGKEKRAAVAVAAPPVAGTRRGGKGARRGVARGGWGHGMKGEEKRGTGARWPPI